MSVTETIRTIFEGMEYGKRHSLTSSDIKDKAREISGHYPTANEFRVAMDELRSPNNTLGIITCGFGYCRVKPGWPSALKFKKSQTKSIIKRNNLIKAL